MTDDLLVYYHLATNRLVVKATRAEDGADIDGADLKVTILDPRGNPLSAEATDIVVPFDADGSYEVVLGEDLVTQTSGRLFLKLTFDAGAGLRLMDYRVEAKVV